MDRRRLLAGALVVTVVAVAWAWQQQRLASTVRADARTESTVMHQVARLPVADTASTAGYDRRSFAWREDTDRNGCDTRNDVLRRDLANVVILAGSRGCVVAAGVLRSPYSGEELPFRRGVNSVDIDHVVALSNAWRSGASRWDTGRRRSFANDPLNLVAVESTLNQEKGDADASAWLPPDRTQRCAYVGRQVAVKSKYGLSVTDDERRAMVGVLARCAGHRAVTEDTVGWPTPGGPVNRGRG